MIRVTSVDGDGIHLTLRGSDVIGLQVGLAWGMIELGNKVRSADTNAKREYWQCQLDNLERDWGQLQQVIQDLG